MKNNKTVWIMALLFVLLLGGAYGAYTMLLSDNTPNQLTQTEQRPNSGQSTPSASGSEGEPEKVKAPDFTVYDGEENPVKLSDFQGKPVILNFWASWCGPCQREMPDFQEAYEQYGEDIHFVMVNATDGQRETVEKASAFVEEKGYEFPVYYDTSYEANIAYGVRGLPTTIFLDEEGYAVAVAQSMLDRETLQRGIDMIYTEE